MAALAVWFDVIACNSHIFCMRDDLQVLSIPTSVNATAVMQFHAVGNRTAKPDPAQPVGGSLRTLPDASIGIGRPGVYPAGS
jgi:hypothetical protein